MIPKILFLLLSYSAANASTNPVYPEEQFRSKWDRGCDDWNTKATHVAGISVKTIREDGVYRIYAAAKLVPSKGDPLDKSYKIAAEILSKGLEYPKWVMPGINQDPSGEEYFLKLSQATTTNHRTRDEFAIRGLYSMTLLWKTIKGYTSILLKHDQKPLPQCPQHFDLKNNKDVTKITFRMIPKEKILDYMVSEAYVAKAKSYVDLRMRAVLKPAPVMYNLLPEKLLIRQVEQRAQRVFANFMQRHADLMNK